MQFAAAGLRSPALRLVLAGIRTIVRAGTKTLRRLKKMQPTLLCPADGRRTWWLAGRRSRRSAFALRASVDSLHGYESEGWAHFEFTRINIEPIILRKKIEDLREARGSAPIANQHPG